MKAIIRRRSVAGGSLIILCMSIGYGRKELFKILAEFITLMYTQSTVKENIMSRIAAGTSR